MSIFSNLNKDSFLRFFKVAGVKSTPAELAAMPFGRRIEYLKALEAFKTAPNTRRNWISLKGRKSPGPAVREFVKLYGAKEYYVSIRWESDYRDDSVEIFYTV